MEILEASAKTSLSVQVPHVRIWSVKNLDAVWSLSHLWPIDRGDGVAVFLEINNAALVWGTDRKRPPGTVASRLTVPEELKRFNAPAWIKLFLLAVIMSGTYDMLSGGWLTCWQESSLFDLIRRKPPYHSTAQHSTRGSMHHQVTL